MQTFAKKDKRITESIVKFDGFDYKSRFTENFKEGNKAKFLEEFTDTNNGNVRKNIHTLNIKSLEETEKTFLSTVNLKLIVKNIYRMFVITINICIFCRKNIKNKQIK